METKVLNDYTMVGKRVTFTAVELLQMSEMCNKIVDVIENHQKKDEKKIYLSDDDLYTLEAIFMCILETDENLAETAFDQYKQIMKQKRAGDNGVDKNVNDTCIPVQV